MRRGGGGRTAASTVGVEEAPVITRLDSAPAGQDIRGIPAQTLVWMDISASTVSSNVHCATQVGYQYNVQKLSNEMCSPQVCLVVTPYLEGVAALLASLDSIAWIPVPKEPGAPSAKARVTAARASVIT